MDFILKELRNENELKAKKGMYKCVVVLSGQKHQFVDEQLTFESARIICVAYSRGNTVWIYDEHGQKICPWTCHSVGTASRGQIILP